MEVLNLLQDLKNANIRIEVSENKLRVTAPAGAMTKKLSVQIQQNKSALVRLLKRSTSEMLSGEDVMRLMESGERCLLSPQHWSLDCCETGERKSIDWVQVHEYKVSTSLIGLEKFSELLALVIAYHDGLRSVPFKRDVPFVRGEVEQKWGVVIFDNPSDLISVIDVRQMDEEQKNICILDRISDLRTKISSLKHILAHYLIVQDVAERRLVVIIHHLVTDGASNKIFEQHLREVMSQYVNGNPIEFFPKPCSIFELAEKLMDFNNSLSVRKEAIDYWNNLPLAELEPLTYRQSGSLPELYTEVASLSFSIRDTSKLLDYVLLPNKLSMPEFLSWVFGKAIYRTSGNRSMIVTLQATGRNLAELEGFESTLLDRTIGWVTSCERYFLTMYNEDSRCQELRKITAQMRATPHKGISFDVIQSALDVELGSEIYDRLRVNYFGSVSSQDQELELLEPSVFYTKPDPIDEKVPAIPLITLKSIIADGTLILHLEYNLSLLSTEEAEEIISVIKDEIDGVVNEEPTGGVIDK